MNLKHTVSVEYHAGDCGLFPAQSRQILDCSDHGVLNAVSVITTGSHLAAYMETFRPYENRLGAAVHLTFVEGRAFCPGILTNQAGNFHVTFGTLLIHFLLPDRRKCRQEEIRA